MKARKRNFLHLRHCTGKSREQYRENTKMHKYPKVIISDNFDRRVLYLTVQKLKALILSGRTLTQLESYWGCSRDCRKKKNKKRRRTYVLSNMMNKGEGTHGSNIISSSLQRRRKPAESHPFQRLYKREVTAENWNARFRKQTLYKIKVVLRTGSWGTVLH